MAGHHPWSEIKHKRDRERKLVEDIEARRNDAGFMIRLRALISENKEVLKRLSR